MSHSDKLKDAQILGIVPSLFKIRHVIHSPLSQEFLSEKVTS